MNRRVLLYELNEVPWHIIDLYAERRPGSALAGLLRRALTLTTVCDDPEPLQPWRTWPTFHNSQFTAEHGSLDLGQDPDSFRGEPMWDVADRAGRVVGIFGPMQSWPAMTFQNGGFYVPDTFARTPETVPETLGRFQSFNLAMTQENTFNPDGKLSPAMLARTGLDLVRMGLSVRSALTIARHLAAEVRDKRHRSSRSTMQALPSFDLYWRLHRNHRPDLSIFFTNHVAGMMHRYWGDGVPGYQTPGGYEPDPIFAGFVMKAMDIFDRQLRTLLRWSEQDERNVLVIASSMGQFAIDKEDVDETFVLDSPLALAERLGLDAEVGSAMYPRTSLLLEDSAAAGGAKSLLASIRTEEGPLFEDLRVMGRSISFAIDQRAWGRPRTEVVRYLTAATTDPVAGTLADLGVSIRNRMGGGNTAYHVPEGIFLATGSGIGADPGRQRVSVLDAAPSILTAMGVKAPPAYRGTPSIVL